ncbi:hypothetical protein [Chromohalobacter israelensis]|uniref:hypothetical protein n=1 Tax=Chromohalobacter israelensis TaxID=141390 RepID=UPI0002F0089C|nr:hypothetical protein [Chromohalobacter salexigens]
MLKVTLDLRCNVCHGERFVIPTGDEQLDDIRCADCHAFKCKSDDLERAMSAIHQTTVPRGAVSHEKLVG